MKTLTTSYPKIVQTSAVSFLIALALFLAAAFPLQSRAQSNAPTVAELQTLINQLMASINAMQGSPAGVCPYTWTRSLGQGSTGSDVMKLQQYMNANADTRLAVSGAGSPGSETVYYGPITANAVSRFQVKYRSEILTPLGLTNPTGYFGPASMAKANQLCTSSTPGQPPVTGDLKGGAGNLDDVELMNSIVNEDVGEGEDDVEVLGLEMTAEGSDIEITALNLDFDQVGHNVNFNRYAKEVKIWLDGEEYATLDADQFTRSNNYQRTVSLDRGAIIRQGDTGELVVTVSGANSIDSDNVDDQWTVKFESLRFRDAQNAYITDNQMDDLSRTITFREFAASSGLNVVVRSGDSTINTARTIEVSANERTNDVEALSFRVEVEGDSDVLVDEIIVNATTTGGTLEDVISGAHLLMDDDEVGSESITAAATTISFDDLDLTLEAGETYEFVVELDLNSANGTNYSTGATIDLDVTTANRDNWYIEDENGNVVATTDRQGSASGEAHILSTSGTNLKSVSVSTREVADPNNTSANYGEFRMTVDVTAIGDTVYVPETAVRSSSATTSAGAAYRLEDSNGNAYTAGTATQSWTRVSGGSVEGNFIRIDEGETVRFELVITLDPAAAAQYRLQLVSIGWNDTAANPDSTMNPTPSVNFRTGLQFINN